MTGSTFKTNILGFTSLFWKQLFIVIYPLLLAILPIAIPTNPAKGAYILLLVTGFWVTEAIPLYATALIPVFLTPLLGVAPASSISVYYMKDTNMLFVGGLLLAITIESNNLHKRIALIVLGFVGGDPKMLMLGFMLPTWFLSMWMSNTATTAMMITIADAIISELSSLTEEPISASKDIENPPDNLSVPMRTLDKDDAQTEVDTLNPNSNKSISYATALAKQKRINAAFCLSVTYSSTCGGIATITGTPPNSILYGIIQDRYGTETGFNFGTWLVYAFPISIVLLFFCWLTLVIQYMGMNALKSLKQSSKTKMSIANSVREKKESMGKFSYAELQSLTLFIILTILWVTRNLGSVGWGDLFKISGKSYASDSTPSILIGLIAMALPAASPIAIWRHWCENGKSLKNIDRSLLKPLLPWKAVQEKLPWGIVLLLGSGFAVAEICHASGLSNKMGIFLAQNLTYISTSVLAVVCLIIGSFVTEFMSNAAAVSILIPISLGLTQRLRLHPFQLAFPITLGCSFAFMLPAGTPPNAIVFAKGHVTVKNMVSSGFVLNIISTLIGLFASLTYAQPLFDLSSYPEWAG